MFVSVFAIYFVKQMAYNLNVLNVDARLIGRTR